MQISQWSCDDVRSWLETEGFSSYASLLCDEHEIDGEILLTLTEKDLRDPPLQLKKLRDIKKLEKCLKDIQRKHQLELKILSVNNGMDHDHKQFSMLNNFREHVSGSSAMNTSDEEGAHVNLNSKGKPKEFLPEYKKLLVSFLYAFVASWITAYMMVIVHEKVPDTKKYPPLPDIFLDNVPLIPYAFQLAEVCGLFLGTFFLGILVFHKHRAIVLRRFFSIASTVFLLRSVTMFVTSLSVPGEHLNCQAIYYSRWQRITRATQIVLGFGMSLTGLQTCGDYMFSGHTAYLTLFNHLVTEYTPRSMHLIHTASWVLNLFGVFFILAAHEHYSIDVFIALYITSRTFLYYHMLTNTRSYSHSKRIKVWFPLLSYFECNVPGKVPNVFEWPLSCSNLQLLKTKLKRH